MTLGLKGTEMTNTLTILRAAKEVAQQVRGDYMLDGKELEALKASHLALIASMESQPEPDDLYFKADYWKRMHDECRAELITMKSAQPSEPKTEPSDDLVVALAEVRDMFPTPEHGSPIEREWASAMADPCSVPDYVRACISQPKAEPGQEPMFWVRLQSDGGYQGPIHNDAIEKVRRLSGTWQPLYLYAAPQARKQLTTQQIDEAVTNWFSSDWAQKAARGLLDDLGIEGGAT